MSTTIKTTIAIPTQATTTMKTSTTTIVNPSTTMTEKTTTAPIENNKTYEFQSNFSRNNDSVFVSLHSNASDLLISINNTFNDIKNVNYPCEIVFKEYSNRTKIWINFNGSFTRDLALQLGDRLIDMADLLSTVRSMNNTVEVV